MAEVVRVLVKTNEVTPLPVDGVNVYVYDEGGAALVTSGVTGAPASAGTVEFILLEGSYTLRLWKAGYGFTLPQLISVESPPSTTNDFLVTAAVVQKPLSTDPTRCVVYGYLRKPGGAPRVGADVTFTFLGTPRRVGDDVVVGGKVHARTDARGYIQAELLRGGHYGATVEGLEDQFFEVVVPSTNNVLLADVLFPYITSITFTPPGPWTIARGSDFVVVPVVTLSSGAVLAGTASDDLVYTIDNTAVADVSIDLSNLVIHGKSAGTTTLRIRPSDGGVGSFPEANPSWSTVTITVG